MYLFAVIELAKMRDRNLRLLNVQSESEFPHLFLDLSDSEDDESSSCTKIIGDQNNANIKESESFPISECGYVPIKCKVSNVETL